MRLPGKDVYLLFCIIALSQFGCSTHPAPVSASLNQNAELVGDLPVNPLRWRVITSTIDQSTATMATLFGNDPAVEYARSHSQTAYPAGSVICLVTWTQREDPRWFGAEIPDRVMSVEFVTVAAGLNGELSNAYAKYEGTPLKKVRTAEGGATTERTAYLLSLRAAVLP